MKYIKFSSQYVINYVVSFALVSLVYLLYNTLGIILPFISNPIVQIIWFLVFSILATKQLFFSKMNVSLKILQVLAVLVIAVPVQFVNLLGGIVTMTEPTTAVSKCSDYPIYSKHSVKSGAPSIYVYKSFAPMLYLQPINIRAGYLGQDDNELKAEVSDFKSSDEFNKFTNCVDFKYNKVLICKNLYYGTNYLEPNQADYDDTMPKNINDYTEPTLQARFYHENKLACQK